MFENIKLGWIDLLILVIYAAFVLAVGIISARRSKGSTVKGYFLASRDMHWVLIGASLFSSNIGSRHFVGLAGSAAVTGIGSGAFELCAILTLIMLGWIFVPVYMSSGIYTMPEYLHERFGGQRIRVYLSVLALFLAVFTKISGDLYAGAIFLQEAIGESSTEWMYISVVIQLLISAVFITTGGLYAVIWTDFVQTILMVGGSVLLAVVALDRVGGYEKLLQEYPVAVPSNVSHNYMKCVLPPDYAMNFMRSAVPGESDLPWPGLLIGGTLSSVWYWCTDQVIVQRALAGKNIIHAKAGCVLASLLKVLPLFLLILPGMVARVLFPNDVACIEPEICKQVCGNENGCNDMAYIKLVFELFPKGLRGLMLAVLMAALLSSLTSVFNSSATIFTIDIWERIRKTAWKSKSMSSIEFEKIIVGRIFSLVLMATSVAWIPIIQNSEYRQLTFYAQSTISFLAPPICAVYMVAIFWKRANEPGAFWGLLSGLIIGMTRFFLQTIYRPPSCGSDEIDSRPAFIKATIDNIHFLHFGILLFCVTILVTAAVSLMTEPIPERCLHRLTFASRFNTATRKPIHQWKKEQKNRIIKTDNDPKIEIEDSTCWKVLHKFCCLTKSEKNEEILSPSPEDEAKLSVELLKEDKTSSRLVNCGAIISLGIMMFFFGFYA